MIDIMMMIGPFPFGINTAAYDALSRTSSWRWKSQARVGRAPALQFVGPDAQSITLSGIILPAFRGGLGQVAAMRDVADTGEPQLLVDGRGFVLGDWVIKSIDEREGAHLSHGAPQRIEFSMTLEEYGEDQTPSLAIAAAPASIATDATGGQTGGRSGAASAEAGAQAAATPLILRFEEGPQ